MQVCFSNINNDCLYLIFSKCDTKTLSILSIVSRAFNINVPDYQLKKILTRPVLLKSFGVNKLVEINKLLSDRLYPEVKIIPNPFEQFDAYKSFVFDCDLSIRRKDELKAKIDRHIGPDGDPKFLESLLTLMSGNDFKENKNSTYLLKKSIKRKSPIEIVKIIFDFEEYKIKKEIQSDLQLSKENINKSFYEERLKDNMNVLRNTEMLIENPKT